MSADEIQFRSADFVLGLSPSWEIRTLFLALQFLFAPGHLRTPERNLRNLCNLRINIAFHPRVHLRFVFVI